MKELLIINKYQFGYHTTYYKYCEYLRNDFKITFICFDVGLKKLEMHGVEIKYISHKGPTFLRGLRYIINVLLLINKFKGEIFVHHFDHCSILKKIYPKRKMILDFRSQSIHPIPHIRKRANQKMRRDALSFDFTTIITEGVRNCLNLVENKTAILPIGSDVISKTDKVFDYLRLVYVGSLDGRNIEDTINGVFLFKKNNPNIKITYNIIGDGSSLIKLKNLVRKLNLGEVIFLHGRIPHFEIEPYFASANIGVSYIPMTDHYDIQPPTKTYEYILSGIPCIATNTSENKKLINNTNGVLCNDSSTDFANAIYETYNNLENFNSNDIRLTLKDSTWEKIVKNYLKPILLNNEN